MTIRQYRKITKTEFYELYGYHKYHYYNLAIQEHKERILQMRANRPGVFVVLHHIKPGCRDYEKWHCIPMYEDEHILLHQKLGTIYYKGYRESAETKAKRSRALRGIVRTQQWKESLSESNEGVSRSLKDRTKMSNSQTLRFLNLNERLKCDVHSGKHWYNNGEQEVLLYECPEGWTQGRSPEMRKKLSAKGKFWFTNGIINVMQVTCPEGFRPGYIRDII